MDERTEEQKKLESLIADLTKMHFSDIVTIRNSLDKFITEDAHRRGFKPYSEDILGKATQVINT